MSTSSIGNRKLEHIDLALNGGQADAEDVWREVRLRPVSLPSISSSDVDLSTTFLGHTLRAPLFVAGMTGGHPETEVYNARLAAAAEATGTAMGVGSQRAALDDPDLLQSYAVARQVAPKVFLCGNIGISQIIEDGGDGDTLKRLVDMIEADALAVHLNVLQEIIQPEGSIELSRAWDSLAAAVEASPAPVIVKETGCGIDRETAEGLARIGVAAIDVGGAGGTSFVRIEGLRAGQADDDDSVRLAETFADWGLTTPLSLLEVHHAGLPVIATGGITSGLEAAKALSLGAHLAGVGRKLMAAAMQSEAETTAELTRIIDELRLTLLLSDCRTTSELARRSPVLSGEAAAWAAQTKSTE